MEHTQAVAHREPWNKGKIVGQKAPLKLKDIWALRVRLQVANRVREMALFNLGTDSKLRGCDLVRLKVRDVCDGNRVARRAIVMQQKTQRPVQFEITELTRDAVQTWVKHACLRSDDFLPKPDPRLSAPRDTPVRSDLGGMGRGTRARHSSLRHALNQAHEGDAHIPTDEEPPGRSAPAGTHEARKHRPLPRH